MANFLLDFQQVQKESGRELVNQPLPWTYPQGASIPVL
jgi:hypothetical protein